MATSPSSATFRRCVLGSLAAAIATASIALAVTGSSAGRDALTLRETPCPRGVMAARSSLTPVADAVRAAQRLLATQKFENGTTGTVYRLVPNNAPIDFIERVAFDGGPLDGTIPGHVPIYRTAVAECGYKTAEASWAIHYDIIVASIAGAGGWQFLVKTRKGWRLWGYWCGADKSLKWRNTYCD